MRNFDCGISIFAGTTALVGVVTIGVRKVVFLINIEYGCHPEALEGCALDVRQCIAAGAKRENMTILAFARILREPQHDTFFIFRTPMVTTPTKAKNY